MAGTQQSGVLDLKLADIVKDEGLMQQSRRTAQEIIETDPRLESPMNAVLRKYFMEKHKVNDFSMIS